MKPEVVLGGPLIDKIGDQRLAAAVVWRDRSELDSLLDMMKSQGAVWVKVYAGFPTELLAWFTQAAHARELKVAAHPRPCNVTAFIESNVDEVEHIISLAGVTRRPAPGMHSLLRCWADPMRSNEITTLASLLSRTALCPTLAVHRRLLDIAAYREYPVESPPELIEQWNKLRILASPWTVTAVRDAEQASRNMAQCALELHDHGVPLVVGSDTPNPGILPGDGLWDEINLLVQAGLTPAHAYLMASVAPAGIANEGRHDLVLLHATTATQASAAHGWPVRPVAGVIRDGCLFTDKQVEAT